MTQQKTSPTTLAKPALNYAFEARPLIWQAKKPFVLPGRTFTHIRKNPNGSFSVQVVQASHTQWQPLFEALRAGQISRWLQEQPTPQDEPLVKDTASTRAER